MKVCGASGGAAGLEPAHPEGAGDFSCRPPPRTRPQARRRHVLFGAIPTAASPWGCHPVRIQQRPGLRPPQRAAPAGLPEPGETSQAREAPLAPRAVPALGVPHLSPSAVSGARSPLLGSLLLQAPSGCSFAPPCAPSFLPSPFAPCSGGVPFSPGLRGAVGAAGARLARAEPAQGAPQGSRPPGAQRPPALHPPSRVPLEALPQRLVSPPLSPDLPPKRAGGQGVITLSLQVRRRALWAAQGACQRRGGG